MARKRKIKKQDDDAFVGDILNVNMSADEALPVDETPDVEVVPELVKHGFKNAVQIEGDLVAIPIGTEGTLVASEIHAVTACFLPGIRLKEVLNSKFVELENGFRAMGFQAGRGVLAEIGSDLVFMPNVRVKVDSSMAPKHPVKYWI